MRTPPSRLGMLCASACVITAVASGLMVSAATASSSKPAPRTHPESWEPVGPASAPSMRSLAARGWTPETFTPAMVDAVKKAAEAPRLAKDLSGIIMGTDGSVQWASNTGVARLPASTHKLTTALVALHSLDPSSTFPTQILSEPAKTGRPAGIYVRGGGDPTLTPARVTALVKAAVAKLPAYARTGATLYVDDTLFPQPTNAAGWKPVYFSDGDVQPVRPLTYYRYKGADGPLQVGNDVAAGLRAAGVKITQVKRQKLRPGASGVATVASGPVSAIVKQMLNKSENDFAEVLLRQAALKAGKAASWEGALGHMRSVLGARQVPVQGFKAADGSGLSRSNAMPVPTLAGIVKALWSEPKLSSVAFAADGVPRAGQSGTLFDRFKDDATSCAQGRVWAKTGTLDDANGLAGVVHSDDGTTRIFALVQNGSSNQTKAVRQVMDTLVTAAVGCSLPEPARR